MTELYNGAPGPSREKPTPTTNPGPWATHATALAAWTDKHLVNRRDAYGGYYAKGGTTHTTTRKAEDKGGPLTLATLVRHFKAKGTDAVIGLHSTRRDEAGECWSRWLGIDVDRHGEGGDPEANTRFVLALFALLVSLGFRPILTDSDGKGGYHLRIVFAAPLPTRLVFAFARWLIRDWESHGLEKEPETFPKQPGIPEAAFGNWMRLFGRHPKRDHWSSVYDGTQWLDGAAAIKHIVTTEGADESLIPAEARPDPNAPFDLGRAIEAKRARDDAADLAAGKPKREKAGDGTTEPGEDFNNRASWESILVPHGWVLDHESEGTGFWRRPGKVAGVSATTNHNGNDTLYVFTDGSVFRQSGSYSKFGAYTVLEHGGDFTNATRMLSQGGYGTFKTWTKDGNGQWLLEERPNPCPKGVRFVKPGEGSPVEIDRGKGKPATSTNGDGRPPIEPHVNGQTEQPRKRPAIEVNPQRHHVLAETLAVLPEDPTLFCRGNTLVKIAEPCQDEESKLPGGVVLRKARGSVRITAMGEAGLSCRITATADLYSWFTQNGEAVSKPVHPPAWLAKAVIEHGVYPGVRPLEGVAEVPFPRPDGTLVTTPGYDPVTGFYYSPSVVIGRIPDRPSKADAQAAAGVLLALVKQFPFATGDDKAVWLAYVLTTIARPAIEGPVPGTAFNGNKAGTGKGKLIDTGSTIVNGRSVPTTTYPRDEAEAEKVKVAFALAGTQIAHLDNIEEGRTYGGGVVDSALTTTECGGRILGLSKNVEGLALRTVWVLSGNNISPIKDAHRRWMVCNLTTDLERPEERGDLEITDLLEHVRGHRAELVRAALVILRAHAAAGWPNGGWAVLGSYEQWDKIVRGAVWYATGLDCNATRRKAAEDSPDRLNKLALLEAWQELPNGGAGGFGVTSEEAHRLAFGWKDGTGKDIAPSQPTLAEVLVRFSKDGKVSPRNIGNLIRGMKGQNFNGMAFRTDRDHKRSAQWYVGTSDTSSPRPPDASKNTPLLGESGESGESGSSLPRATPDQYSDVMAHGSNGKKKQSGPETHSPDSPDSPALADRETGEI